MHPPARAEILLHRHFLQPDSFREAGRHSARNQNKAARSESFNLKEIFSFSVSI